MMAMTTSSSTSVKAVETGLDALGRTPRTKQAQCRIGKDLEGGVRVAQKQV
jgi:hypothetical protein